MQKLIRVLIYETTTEEQMKDWMQRSNFGLVQTREFGEPHKRMVLTSMVIPDGDQSHKLYHYLNMARSHMILFSMGETMFAGDTDAIKKIAEKYGVQEPKIGDQSTGQGQPVGPTGD